MDCEKYEALIRLQPVSLLGLEERKQLDKHLKDCSLCVLQSRELQLAYTTMKAPLEPYPLNEDRIFESIIAKLPEQSTVLEESNENREIMITLSCCYCHDSLARSQAVYCASCLSPHHSDCFAEHGLCSAIGCREIKTVAPNLNLKVASRRSRSRPKYIAGSIIAVALSTTLCLQLHSHYQDWKTMAARITELENSNAGKDTILTEEYRLVGVLKKANNSLQKANRVTKLELIDERESNANLRSAKIKRERSQRILQAQFDILQKTNEHLQREAREDRAQIQELERQLKDQKTSIKQKQRFQEELDHIRSELRRARERAEFQLSYFEQQVKHLHGMKNAEEIVRAGRLPQWLTDLESESSENRVNLIHKIAEIGPTATLTITPLIKRLGDLSLNVRLAAIGALRAIGPDASVALSSLKKLYENCENDPLGLEKEEIDQLRLSILRSYGDLGFRALQTVPQLEAALEHDNPKYALAALESLTKLALFSDFKNKANQNIRKTLRRELISLNFADMPIEQALDFIGRHIGLKIELSQSFYKSLKAKNTMVNLRLRLISVHNALRLILSTHSSSEFKVIQGRLIVRLKDEKPGVLGLQSKDEESPVILKERARKAIGGLARSPDKDLAAAAQESLKRIRLAAKNKEDRVTGPTRKEN